MRSSAATRNGLTSATRPGSALIIVIGTLALISVFAAIYIAVGQNDRRSASTVRERANLAEITDAHKEHIARTIAINRLDALLQPVDAERQYQIPRRITTDAPWTDWTQRSETNELWRRFNPAGHNQFPFPRNTNTDDPRVASDSWLATTRPTYLGHPTLRILSQGDQTRAYLDNRDWYQITNIAPDGRFVNLANLRGNFRAQPGVGSGRMSENLTIFQLLNPNRADSPVQSISPMTLGGTWIPGYNETQPVFMNPQDYLNTPAVFTMFQRFAFLPSAPSFVIYNRNRQVAGSQPNLLLNDPDFAPYQWADADGDGMYDSRWFELTAARTPSPTSGQRNDIERFYDDSEYRVFAAARIIDLSSMVNVNTAIEGVTPPTQRYPLGLTPAEIDLRRLLSMQDIAEEYDSIDFVIPRQPLSFASLWEPGRIQGTGNNQQLRAEGDYTNYSHISDGNSPRLLDPDSNAMLVGRYAAAGIRRGMEQHTTLSQAFAGARTQFPPNEEPYLLYEGSQLQRQREDPTSRFDFYAGGRAESYLRIGRADPTRLGFSTLGAYDDSADGGLESAYFRDIDDRPFGLYGIDDLAELLTYHGLNDPDVTSRLEHNALGRYDSGEGQERYSPLMSTRPLTIDRDRHAHIRTDANPNRPRIIDGRIAQQTLALAELSPRTVLTPLSGAVPLVPKSVAGPAVRSPGGASADPLPASVQPLTIAEAAVTLKQVSESANDAFKVFYSALAGELEAYRFKRQGPQDGPNAGILNQIWRSDLTAVRDSPYATLFYAHRGPELALRIAAHSAVNMKTRYSDDPRPTVATLVLSNQFGDSNDYRTLRQNLRDESGRRDFDLFIAQNRLAIFYPGLVGGKTRFDVDAQDSDNSYEANRRDENQWVLAPTTQNPPMPAQRQAVNVFGVDAMPVITEVASFYVYTDASVGAGGDPDYFTAVDGRPIPVVGATQVTIQGSVSETNSDLLASVVAFQIHNPWDVAISLGGRAEDVGPRDIMWRVGDNGNHFNHNNNLQFDYYIEYNGRYFKLGEFWEYTPSADSADGFGPDEVTQINEAGGNSSLIPNPGERLDRTYEEFQYRNIILAPGQTRVFYAMSHARFEGHDVNDPTGLEFKWNRVATSYGDPLPTQFTDPSNDHDNDGLIDGGDSKGWTGLAQEWIENQLSVMGDGPGVRIHAFDPTSGRLVDPRTGDADTNPQFADIIGTPGTLSTVTGRDPQPNQVRLWRKFTLVDEQQPQSGNYEEATDFSLQTHPRGSRRNIVQNDILVDRLFLGDQSSGTSYLDVALDGSGDGRITGTVSFQENFNNSRDDCSPRNDNAGLSVMRWATVRRRDHLAADGENINNPGVIYPWMIQSRTQPDLTWIRKTNKAGHPGAIEQAFDDQLDISLFFEVCTEGADPSYTTTTVRRRRTNQDRYDLAYHPMNLINRGLGSAATYRVVPSIAKSPFQKSDNRQDATIGDRFERIGLGSNHVFHTLQSDNLNPEIVLGSNANASRIGDALMSMGIGPTWAPDITRDPTSAELEDSEWMTLTEAFAMAFGYESNAPFSSEPEAANHVWFDAVRQTPGAGPTRPNEYVLDNLHLRLDDYVPFLNVIRPTNETGSTGRPVFTSDQSLAGDFRRGAGVPLALTVIDQLRPFDVLALPGDATLPPDKKDLLPLTRPVMGLVNVQTAPLKVLRLLPGLSPSAQPYRASESSGTLAPEWWAAQSGIANASELNVAQLQPSTIADNPDAAAGIAAYRDRMVATPRARSFDPAQPLSYLPPQGNTFQLATNLRSEQSGTAVERATISGIPGLRGSPMFASLGELLAVSIDERDTSLSPAQRRHLTIQAYYGDGRNLGASGSSDTDRVGIDPKLTSGQPGVTEDDYAERLALAAGIMNTTSVRSDYFAAWFVIQGFRESDVNGLRPEDPLVPSFKRRYLMVIDRSNVIEPTDAPRIVLFKELPL